MIGYEDFAKLFMETLQQQLPEGTELSRRDVTKTNGIVKDGLSVRYADYSNIAPTVYLDDAFTYYKNHDGATPEDMARDTARMLASQRSNMPEMPDFSPEAVRANLYCVLVNAEKNMDLLKDTPHELIEDLAVICRYRVGDNGSFVVTNDLCRSQLRLTSDEILEIARVNTERQGFDCMRLSDMIREQALAAGMPEEMAEEMYRMQEESLCMFVMTNKQRYDGAIALASKQALKDAYEKIGGDFYVLPSSRHEVILLPTTCSVGVEDLKQMVKDINASTVAAEERLSDFVYKYDGRQLTLADKRVEVKEQVAERHQSHAMSR